MLSHAMSLKLVFFYIIYTQETHLLHDFAEDFYGSHLKICICGFIREMRNFGSVGMYELRFVAKLHTNENT